MPAIQAESIVWYRLFFYSFDFNSRCTFMNTGRIGVAGFA
jgi:hypothetical protein